jgi:hypothetical protein
MTLQPVALDTCGQNWSSTPESPFAWMRSCVSAQECGVTSFSQT